MEQKDRGKRLVSTPHRKDGPLPISDGNRALQTAREFFVASWLGVRKK